MKDGEEGEMGCINGMYYNRAVNELADAEVTIRLQKATIRELVEAGRIALEELECHREILNLAPETEDAYQRLNDAIAKATKEGRG